MYMYKIYIAYVVWYIAVYMYMYIYSILTLLMSSIVPLGLRDS